MIVKKQDTNKTVLKIFEDFEIDRTLPKYSTDETITLNEDNWGWGSPASMDVLGNSKPTLRERIGNWLLRKSTPKSTPKPKITILDFFNQLSTSFTELMPVDDITEHYKKALKQSKTLGQTALFEALTSQFNVVSLESRLITSELRKYVSEEQVVNLYKEVGEEKNLKLTWIKNFGRIIPENVFSLKSEIDDKKLFDNYVILHYDPENNGEKLTKKEIEKKKDPILFGVIQNSRKLYYIADWKDDYCHLTLDEMFNVLQDDVLTINNKSVKTYIDKVTIK